MTPRTIRTMAAVNVIAFAVLYIWFMTLPSVGMVSAMRPALSPPHSVSQPQDFSHLQRIHINVVSKLRTALLFLDGSLNAVRQREYWSFAAGIVIAINAAVSFWHLCALQLRTRPANRTASDVTEQSPG